MTGTDDRSFGQNPRLKRIENPDTPAGQLGQALRDLIGGESLCQLARRVPCAVAVVSEALSGNPSKVPTTTIIKGICRACNADESTTKRLLDMPAEAVTSKTPGPTRSTLWALSPEDCCVHPLAPKGSPPGATDDALRTPTAG